MTTLYNSAHAYVPSYVAVIPCPASGTHTGVWCCTYVIAVTAWANSYYMEAKAHIIILGVWQYCKHACTHDDRHYSTRCITYVFDTCNQCNQWDTCRSRSLVHCIPATADRLGCKQQLHIVEKAYNIIQLYTTHDPHKLLKVQQAAVI